MNRLKDKVAVITGGTTGIGFATAELFVNEGAKVIITGQNKQRVEAAKEKLGTNAFGIVSDAGKISDIENLTNTIAKNYNKIDILFANAGIAQFKPFEAVTTEDFDNIFNVNVKGLYFTIQKLLPLFNDNGSIILNASVAGSLGVEMASVYCASKAAVRSFGRSLAAYLAPRNIRVNTISPGPIETPIFDKMTFSENEKNEIAQNMTKGVALKRFGKANEVANCVLFYASSESSYVLGTELFVDGGMVEL